jgi:hypothetical protein
LLQVFGFLILLLVVPKCPIILSGNIHTFLVTLLARPIKGLKSFSVLCRFTGMAYPLLFCEAEMPVENKAAQWGTTLMVSFRAR